MSFPFLLPTGCPGVGGTDTPLVAGVTLVNHKVSELWFLQLQMKANIPVWQDCCGQGTTVLRKRTADELYTFKGTRSTSFHSLYIVCPFNLQSLFTEMIELLPYVMFNNST